MKRVLALLALSTSAVAAPLPQPLERLDRGLVAVRVRQDVFLSWRALAEDGAGATSRVYRNGKLVSDLALKPSCFWDRGQKRPATYRVETYGADGKLREPTGEVTLTGDETKGGCWFDIPIQCPAGGATPDGEAYEYWANEASVGDPDGDGTFEVVLKWSPTNAKDPASAGYTGREYFDAYKLDGTRLWRIDMGPNVRAGEHYTQFLVWDFDGDGKAEVMMRTADGTVDGKGRVLSLNKDKDFRITEEDIGTDRRAWRISKRSDRRNDPKVIGRILDGPEYLAVFEGATGRAVKMAHYKPPRGKLVDWGDNYGNRCDRFLAAVAYLDGKHPSAVFCRGYYGRSVLWAVDYDGKSIKERWLFDTDTPGNEKFAGQGNHNIRVGDIDGDGKDEIIYGAMVVDDDGNGLYSTGRGHGDRFYMTRMSLDLQGQQIWSCLEHDHGASLRDARTGKEFFYLDAGEDCDPAICGDFDPTNPGFELQAAHLGWFKMDGTPHPLGKKHVAAADKAVLWKGDLVRSLLGNRGVYHYNPASNDWEEVFHYGKDVMHGRGGKAQPVFVGDFIGDWREEIVMRLADQSALRVYVSGAPTEHRFRTFLQNRQYRIGLALFNIGYNVIAFPSYYFGPDLLKGRKQ